MPPEDESQHQSTILVPCEHPAIPGHFPGNPVVPGVVILHEAILAARRWLGPDLRIRRLQQAKFPAPLRPGEEAVIELTREADRVLFSVRRDRVVLARGEFRLDAQRAS